MRISVQIVAIAWLALLAMVIPSARQQTPTPVPAAQPRVVRFNRDVRPIMAGICFRCHGPDASSRMAGMRLDVREEATTPRRNGTPIVPGRPEDSLVIKRIFETNPARQMPPANIHKDLTSGQKETIRRWIEQGAEYEGHWAYQPLQRPVVPSNPDGGSHPVDAFVLARLADEGIQPSPEADRRTLIRRVTLDLTGMAPTIPETEAFVQDRSPRAYERLVDRLLASPRFAEKQAVSWLDAVRFADTAGFHGDNPYPVWPYRDYVLRAFRDNKPFDEFTREQLAGDLLRGATEEQRIASAFNRLNRVSGEGGIQEKEYLAKYGADRVRTVSSVWMGSTLGCAECHDHKFDPFLAEDFYAMKAFFADLKETGFARDGSGRNGPEAWGVKLELPTKTEAAERVRLDKLIADAARQLRERTEASTISEQQWRSEIQSRFRSGELRWHFQHPTAVSATGGAALTVRHDLNVRVGSLLRFMEKPVEGLIVAGGANPDTSDYTVRLQPGTGKWQSLGLEIARDDSLPGGFVARGGLGVDLSEVEVSVSPAGESRPRPVTVVAGAAAGGRSAVDVSVVEAFDGDVKTAWSVGDFGSSASNPFVAFQFAKAVATDEHSTITVRLRQQSETRHATLGRFRVALSSGPAWPNDAARGGAVEEMIVDPATEYRGLPESLVRDLAERVSPSTTTRARGRDPDVTPELPASALAGQSVGRTYFQLSSPELAPLISSVARLEAQKARLEMRIARVMVSEAMPAPRETRILPRGNWMDDSGAIVEPAIPQFLDHLDTSGRKATRLDLANWLVSPQNPLTARVIANRLWRQVFGIGLSANLGDLGSQGEWPSHPDLLDWLAAEFIQPTFDVRSGSHQWDFKHLVRTMVLSKTYRQSSMPRLELAERDPANRLLARQARFRVDAEIVRDVALAASGLLAERFGGPSVRPYQPEGYLAALNYPRRTYTASRGADLYRRALYTFWQRTFLHPDLLAFDAPSREECVLERTNSNTPLQALDLLNGPIYVEAAGAFAARALAEGGDTPPKQVAWAFYTAVGRPPGPGELKSLTDLHATAVDAFRSNPSRAEQLLTVGESRPSRKGTISELAAMAMVTRTLFNLHETITRD